MESSSGTVDIAFAAGAAVRLYAASRGDARDVGVTV